MKDRCVDCGQQFEPYCMATVYDPDPQDCGEPSVATLRGEPLCGFHYAGALWAEAHQED